MAVLLVLCRHCCCAPPRPWRGPVDAEVWREERGQHSNSNTGSPVIPRIAHKQDTPLVREVVSDPLQGGSQACLKLLLVLLPGWNGQPHHLLPDKTAATTS